MKRKTFGKHLDTLPTEAQSLLIGIERMLREGDRAAQAMGKVMLKSNQLDQNQLDTFKLLISQLTKGVPGK